MNDGNGSADTLTLRLHKGRGVVHQPPAAHALRPTALMRRGFPVQRGRVKVPGAKLPVSGVLPKVNFLKSGAYDGDGASRPTVTGVARVVSHSDNAALATIAGNDDRPNIDNRRSVACAHATFSLGFNCSVMNGGRHLSSPRVLVAAS